MIEPLGRVHCTDGGSPTVTVTVHVREKASPAVGLPGREIVALGGVAEGGVAEGGVAEGWKE